MVSSNKIKKKNETLIAQSLSDSFVTPWTVAHQTYLSVEFSRQEYCSWLPFPSPGDLPHPGIEPTSPALQADSLLSESPEKPLLLFRVSKYSLLGSGFSVLSS